MLILLLKWYNKNVWPINILQILKREKCWWIVSLKERKIFHSSQTQKSATEASRNLFTLIDKIQSVCKCNSNNI